MTDISPAFRKIEIAVSGDDEIDAIAFCIDAMKDVTDAAARRRILNYLHSRFAPPAGSAVASVKE